MVFDYSQTFETEEEAYCRCPANGKRFLQSEAFLNHLDATSNRPSLYRADYVCAGCFKPSQFYVQECEYCPEDRFFFYGRPKDPGDKSFTKCLKCKREGK